MNVLVIAAHPDDEVLGCGATMARLSKEGHSVYIAILGEGITSRFQKRGEADTTLLKSLNASSRKAGDILGAKEVFNSNLPDNRFDTVAQLEIVKIIEEIIDRLEPQVVYTQHGGDLNIDHVITWRSTLTATRPVAGRSIRKVYGYEVPSSTEWAFQKFSPVFHPNTFVDVSATLDLKIEAMRTYETEMRPFPHPRSTEALQAIACRWGSVAGLQAAEAFELVREIS